MVFGDERLRRPDMPCAGDRVLDPVVAMNRDRRITPSCHLECCKSTQSAGHALCAAICSTPAGAYGKRSACHSTPVFYLDPGPRTLDFGPPPAQQHPCPDSTSRTNARFAWVCAHDAIGKQVRLGPEQAINRPNPSIFALFRTPKISNKLRLCAPSLRTP